MKNRFIGRASFVLKKMAGFSLESQSTRHILDMPFCYSNAFPFGLNAPLP